MKFCKDCVYHYSPFISPVHMCLHEKSITYIDKVSGEKNYSWCGKMRHTNCGADATLYEEKQTFSGIIENLFKGKK